MYAIDIYSYDLLHVLYSNTLFIFPTISTMLGVPTLQIPKSP